MPTAADAPEHPRGRGEIRRGEHQLPAAEIALTERPTESARPIQDTLTDPTQGVDQLEADRWRTVQVCANPHHIALTPQASEQPERKEGHRLKPENNPYAGEWRDRLINPEFHSSYPQRPHAADRPDLGERLRQRSCEEADPSLLEPDADDRPSNQGDQEQECNSDQQVALYPHGVTSAWPCAAFPSAKIGEGRQARSSCPIKGNPEGHGLSAPTAPTACASSWNGRPEFPRGASAGVSGEGCQEGFNVPPHFVEAVTPELLKEGIRQDVRDHRLTDD